VPSERRFQLEEWEPLPQGARRNRWERDHRERPCAFRVRSRDFSQGIEVRKEDAQKSIGIERVTGAGGTEIGH